MKTKIYNKNQGFTLIEMVIVIVIGSLILAAIASLAKPYFAERQLTRTVDSVKAVELALANYLANVQAYPCPAPLNTARGTPEDGTPTCAADGTGIFETDGRPDSSSNPRKVLIGAVPYRALNIPVEATIDAYKNRLTYAVTLQSTDPNTYFDNPSDPDNPSNARPHSGAIDVVDGGTSATPATTLLSNPGTAHVFFFSHGADGKGAYTNGGAPVGAGTCSQGIDAGNCDNDATFVASLQSLGTADMYYDDVSTYSLLIQGDEEKFWARSPSVGDAIYNLGSDKVGINTDVPQSSLHVVGDTRIEGAVTATNYLQTGDGGGAVCDSTATGAIKMNTNNVMEYCDGNGEWRPLLNDYNDVSCTGRQAVRSFDDDGKPVCGNVTVPIPAVTVQACGSGQYMSGVTNGQPVCVTFQQAGPAQPAPSGGNPPPAASIACTGSKIMQGIDASGNAICRSIAELYEMQIVSVSDTTAAGTNVAKCPSGTILTGCSSVFPGNRINGRSPGVRPVNNGCEGAAGSETLDIHAICMKSRY